MATTSETTYTHTCDLCGEVHDKQDLRHLDAAQASTYIMGKGTPPWRADICEKCLDKPIRDVMTLFEKRRQDDPDTWRRTTR